MLRQRLVTGVVLVILLLVTLFVLPRNWGILVLALLVLIGAWEWGGFFDSRAGVRLLYVACVGVGLAAAWWWTALPSAMEKLLLITFFWWLIALFWVTRPPARIGRPATAVAGVLVLVPTWLVLARLHMGMERGPEWLLFLFFLVLAADTGAYFTGRRFGRTKLAPSVSPGKTWEGVAGGALAALAAAIAGSYWFAIPGAGFVVLCLGVALFSIVGDLTVSKFKRNAGLKDSGHLFPGHGGILDRIDSICAAAPLGVLGLGILGIVG